MEPQAAYAAEPVFGQISGLPVNTQPAPVNKSYLIPALEGLGMTVIMNGFARLALREDEDEKENYRTSFSKAWENTIHGNWEIDDNRFDTNQLGHPYQGVLLYGFSRSAGLGFWESSIYTFAGSFLWEVSGETARPAINDQIMTGIAGNFLGEPLFRMANLVLEGGGGRPGLWRELGAAALSPPTGFNRLAFGERFKTVFPSRDPAYFWRFGVGESTNSHPGTITRFIPVADFAMYYGLPGKEGYVYDRPFDYFDFRFSVLAHKKNPIGSIIAHGLLAGCKYGNGKDLHGVWGLYGSFDYLSPHLFKASSTAVSLGTTAVWRLSPYTALQGAISGGAGYGAAGIDEEDNDRVEDGEGDDRTYRYGTTFQAQAELLLNLGGLALLEAGVREYYVSRLAGTSPRGDELVSRFNAGLTVRISGRHALGVQYVSTLRDATTHGQPDRHQSVDSVSILYTYLSDGSFGAMKEERAESQGTLRK